MMVIPQNIAKLMSPEDRRAFGKGAMTAEDALAKAEVTNERALQKQIVGILKLKGIEPIVSTFGKKTTTNVGTPDILFSVVGETEEFDGYLFTNSIPCAWEVKFGSGKLSVGQQQMQLRMTIAPNSWRFRTIRSVDQALAELKEMCIE